MYAIFIALDSFSVAVNHKHTVIVQLQLCWTLWTTMECM